MNCIKGKQHGDWVTDSFGNPNSECKHCGLLKTTIEGIKPNKDYGAFSGKMKECYLCKKEWGACECKLLEPSHTPPAQDTEEWEKEFDKWFDEGAWYRKDFPTLGLKNMPQYDKSKLKTKAEVKTFIRNLLTHRDTYWKSIIRREVETIELSSRTASCDRHDEDGNGANRQTCPNCIAVKKAFTTTIKRIKELI